MAKPGDNLQHEFVFFATNLNSVAILQQSIQKQSALVGCFEGRDARCAASPPHRCIFATLERWRYRVPMELSEPVRNLLSVAVGHFEAGRPQQTLAACEQALSLAPDVVAGHIYRGLALRRMGRFDEAIDALERACELDPRNPASFEQLGIARIDLHRREAALNAFHQALALDRTRLLAWVNVGNLSMGEFDFAAAEAAYRQALALKPDVAICHQNLCWVLRRLGRPDEAVQAGQRAIELEPLNLTAYNYLIFALLAADRHAEASDYCDRSLAINARNTSALAFKPSALEGLGRDAEGRALVDLGRLVKCETILSVAGYTDLGAFNRALAEHVTQCPTRPHDDTQTVDLLARPEGPVATLKNMINDAVSRYLEALPNEPGHPYLAFKPSRWALDGWATLLHGMPFQEHHFHQHGWVSGVYYLKVPSFIGNQAGDKSGFIEFCRFPQFGARSVASEFTVFEPHEGMLLLFPSYFYHRVVEFEPSDLRISFAFNVTPN